MFVFYKIEIDKTTTFAYRVGCVGFWLELLPLIPIFMKDCMLSLIRREDYEFN